MASAAASAFKPEDFSRFLIREFLKKSGFDRTYDLFLQEDTRPKVNMTKSLLTDLLGVDALVRANNKTKAHNTMLDLISHFLVQMKAAQNGVALPSGAASATSSAAKANVRGSSTTETTQASTSSISNASSFP